MPEGPVSHEALSVKLDMLLDAQKERMEQYKEDRREIMQRFDEADAKLESHAKKINQIMSYLCKQKGFVAGIVFVVSGVWAIVVTFKSTIVSWFNGGV